MCKNMFIEDHTQKPPHNLWSKTKIQELKSSQRESFTATGSCTCLFRANPNTNMINKREKQQHPISPTIYTLKAWATMSKRQTTSSSCRYPAEKLRATQTGGHELKWRHDKELPSERDKHIKTLRHKQNHTDRQTHTQRTTHIILDRTTQYYTLRHTQIFTHKLAYKHTDKRIYMQKHTQKHTKTDTDWNIHRHTCTHTQTHIYKDAHTLA